MRSAPRQSVTLRVVLLGLLLIPLQAQWIIYMELVRSGIFPTVLTLLFTTIFLLFGVAVLNLALRRWWPRVALRDGELVTLYVILAVGAALSGCDVGQTLVHILPAPYHFATPENGWEAHFHRDLPPGLMVTDEIALKHFYQGASSFYRPENWHPWVRPLAAWMGFIFLLLLTMHSVNTLVQRQWIEAERLTFPIVQLPLALSDTPTFWRGRGLWAGFALAAGLNVLNGLHFLFPVVPQINCRQIVNLGPLLVNRPWSSLGWMPITMYPFALGLGFLMPLDLSFSCWFGLWLWKAQRILEAALGHNVPGLNALYSTQQLSGVWIAVLLFALWMGRRHLRALLRAALAGRTSQRQGAEETSRAPRPEDASQPDPVAADPLSPRTTLALVLLGTVGLILFAYYAGMTVGFAVGYFLVYLAFSLALTRMRAEFGPPCHDLYAAGPDQIFTTWLGPEAFEQRNLTATAVFYWLSRESPRSHPMPHQLEGLRLGHAAHLSLRRLWVVMLIAGWLGGLATFWAVLHHAYIHGSEAKFSGPAVWFATEGFKRLNGWIITPPDPHAGERWAMILAGGVAWFILWLRTRVLWFPFHPAGYAISSWWAINLLWFPLLLSWLAKTLVLRYGGLRAYRNARPFFFGLILGEFVVGSMWQLVGLIGGFTTYAFWI